MSIHQSFFIERTITYLSAGTILQETVNGTTHVLSLPTGVQESDLLVIVFACGGGAPGTMSTSDFTIQGQVSQRGVCLVGSKIATASEPSTYTITSTSSRIFSGVIMAFRNADYDKTGAFVNTTGGNITTTGVTPTKSNSYLLAAGGVDGQETITAPAGMSTLIDGTTDATNPDFSVFFQANVPAAATGNKIIGFSGAGNNCGLQFNLYPN